MKWYCTTYLKSLGDIVGALNKLSAAGVPADKIKITTMSPDLSIIYYKHNKEINV